MAKEIQLGGKSHICAIVDDDEFERLNEFKWYESNGYALRMIRRNGKSHGERMHRVILSAPSNLHVDHINGIKHDNRKENLRLSTRAQNRRNSTKKSIASSRFKGVHRFKKTGKWQASIALDGKTFHMGYFWDELDAARAYDRAAIELSVEFAKINFPIGTKTTFFNLQGMIVELPIAR